MTVYDEVTVLARARHFGALANANIAGGSGDPDVKEDFRQHLEMYLLRLKAIIDKPNATPGLRQAALETLRQFLNS